MTLEGESGRPSTRGDAEHADLKAAMLHATPACAEDPRFTDDAPPASLARVCHRCPLIALCDAYARTARPPAGFWAGRTWEPIPRPNRRKSPPHKKEH